MKDLRAKKRLFCKANIAVPTFLILIGLMVAVVTLYTKPSDMKDVSDSSRLAFNFFELLGFTLFSGGIFSFFLQLPDWKNYFEERLKTIVLEQDYLNSLDADSLSHLQTRTLKALFQASDIDKEGSFLNYFQENLSRYIREPFRDNVRCEIVLVDEDDRCYRVSDRMIYECRMIGGRIQEHVKWRPEREELVEIEDVEFRVKTKTSDFKQVLTVKKDNGGYAISDRKDHWTLDQICQHGLQHGLHEYNEDGLIVEIKSRYKATRERFSTWVMAHPTKSFSLTIKYPETLDIRFEPLLLHPEKVITSRENGFFSMQYNEWLLPQSGVVYSFIAKSGNLCLGPNGEQDKAPDVPKGQ